MKKVLISMVALSLLVPNIVLAEDLILYHAGSLSAAMKAITAAFTAQTGLTVKLVSSGSGSLRQRIEAGERPDVFASADMDNPLALSKKGLAEAPSVFTRNVLSAVARTKINLTPETFLDRLLDPAVKVGTSTPILDPSGDYAWQLFDRADKVRAGSADRLKAKAIKLMGDPALPTPPQAYTKSAQSWFFETNQADLLLIYRSSAQAVLTELPNQLSIVMPPAELAVSAQYGVSTITGAKPTAAQLRNFILVDAGQKILANYGFLPK